MVDAVGDSVGGRADAAQFGLECGELLGAAIIRGGIYDIGQPAGRTVKPGDVVAATGLLAGTPRPEAGRQLVEFAHGQASFVSRIGRRSVQGQRLRNVIRCCHAQST